MPKKVKFHQIGHKKAVKLPWKTERKGKSVPKKVKIHQIGHKITGISLYNGEHMRKVYPK